MGYAFTYPLFRYIGGCRVATYTHYPTISTDMLRHIYKRVISHTNKRVIARNPFLSAAKLIYYKLFGFVCIRKLLNNCISIILIYIYFRYMVGLVVEQKL